MLLRLLPDALHGQQVLAQLGGASPAAVLAAANLAGAVLVLLVDRRNRRRFLAEQREREALQGAAAK